MANDKDYLRLEVQISEIRARKSELSAELKSHLATQEYLRYRSDPGLSQDLLEVLPAASPKHWIIADEKSTSVWIPATKQYIVFCPHLCPPQITTAVYRLSNLKGELNAIQIVAAEEEQEAIEKRIEAARALHDSIKPELLLL